MEIVPERLVSPPLYARAIGSEEQAYYSTDAALAAGLRGRPSPGLAFFHTVDEDALTEVIGVVYGRTLAAGAESEFGVMATERDTVIGQTYVEEAYRRPGKDGTMRQFLVLTTEFRLKETDELVSRSRITFIEKETE
ncbi:MAG: MaoC family dehydratase N-terminal domain-containing protein [Acidimicrobiales bacterium]|nr:MaoC family dehydratase N-terminal domain-containing protein [Acidimicrobiales bacterium]